jgi:hypothetical protein
LLEELEMKGTLTEKLIPNLHPKEKYVVHYRNLKLYLSLGMRLTMIHRVMTFKQQPWLKTYIDFNTQKKRMANNEFEKDFFQTHEQRRVWKIDGDLTQETYSPVGKQPINSEEAHQQAYLPRL